MPSPDGHAILQLSDNDCRLLNGLLEDFVHKPISDDARVRCLSLQKRIKAEAKLNHWKV